MNTVSTLLLTAMVLASPPDAVIPEQDSVLAWEQLPLAGQQVDVAGAFVGVASDALIMAGGMRRSPGNPNGDGAGAEYSDRIHILAQPGARWREAQQRLPRATAYGVSLTWDQSLVCLGGGNADEHFTGAFVLRLAGGQVAIEELPPLPRAAKYACGVLLGDTVYVAGGLEKPNSTEAMKNFWSLNLSKLKDGKAHRDNEQSWKELDPWPGPSRLLAVAGTQDDSVFLFGGVQLTGAQDSEQTGKYLQDAYRYTPKNQNNPLDVGWKARSNLPFPLAASPSPAVALGQSHLILLGSDRGRLVVGDGRTVSDGQDGFDRRILAYHTITDTWVRAGEVGPASNPSSIDEQHQLDRASGRFSHPRAAEPETSAPRLMASLEGQAGSLRHPAPTVATWWRERVVVPLAPPSSSTAAPQILWAKPEHKTSGLVPLDYVVVAGYFVLIIAMGVYFSKREKSTEDFFLGGRRVPWWAAGISIFGTLLSPISFMAIPALIYRTDWVFAPGGLISIAVAPVVIAFYLPFFRRLNVTTAYEYLEKRFNYGTLLVASSVFIVSQFVRMGVVLFLPALALATVTGIDIYVCILVLGVTATFYTVLGGIEAVVWTDVIQVLILFGGVAYCLVVIFLSVPGGVTGTLQLAYDEGKFHAINWSGDITTMVIWLVIGGRFIDYLVSYSSDQTTIQRYLMTPDESAASRAIWTNALLMIPSVLLFFGCGTALWAFYRHQPELLNPVGQNDQIFPWFIAQVLPEGLSGLVIAALFAACMSSLDSSMNAVTAVFTTNFYRRFRPHVSDHHCLVVARWLTLLVGTAGTSAALAVAWLESRSIWEENLKIVGLFMGGLGGIFAAGIFTRRINSSGVIIGFFASVALTYWVSSQGLVHFFLYVAVGFFGCPVIGWLLSWVIPWETNDTTGLTIYSLPPESDSALSTE